MIRATGRASSGAARSGARTGSDVGSGAAEGCSLIVTGPILRDPYAYVNDFPGHGSDAFTPLLSCDDPSSWWTDAIFVFPPAPGRS
ncbi:hypothetical protein Smic_45740 [Streptomyces microflavus]|uniref:Uncharacterized protein n=1 Tax=Streptomyces microflavus TaxID=1919 RepID=A0A7J0CUE5_STRMI|nr:hypothetical protein Smic_45740 [Streptomyces microflavus]